MFSFYGGKPGNSFVIVKSFPSIGNTTDDTEANNLSMAKNFSKGVSYTQVHYGEYVIIDTENKNDPDNGKIFKRGTHIENEFGGAEYFAQIVGPSGNATNFHYDSYNNILTIPDEQEGKIVTKENREESLTQQTTTFVPGKYNLPSYQGGGVQYNDKLKWRTCKVRDINNKTEDFYIGFQIPYLVTDFEVSEVNPYQSEISINRVDDQSHPFYQKWNINIPASKKGNEIKNIRIFDWFDHRNNINDVEDYSGRYDDWNEGRSPGDKCILVGDYYDYSETTDPTPKTIYLGDYNVIKNISIENDGKIKTQFTHGASEITENSIVKWPTNIHIDTGMTGEGDGDQKIYIDWNDGTNTIIGEPINYILEAAVDDQNRLLVRYSDPNRRRGSNITYNGKTGWTNIGIVGNDISKINEISNIVQKEYSVGESFSIINNVKGIMQLSAANNFKANQSFINFYVPHSFIKFNGNLYKMQINNSPTSFMAITGKLPKILNINNENYKIDTTWFEKRVTNSVEDDFSFNNFEIYNSPTNQSLRFTLYLSSQLNNELHNTLITNFGSSDYPLNNVLLIPLDFELSLRINIIDKDNIETSEIGGN